MAGSNIIIIVFGLSATGKSYIGKVLQTYFNFHYEDADNWLPEEMKDYVHQKKLFSLEMLDNYTNIIISKIKNLSQAHPKLVISQALYRQKNREQIQHFFPSQKLIFLQVEADKNIINQRIIDRGDWVDLDYAKEMHSYFQPMIDAKIIINNDNGERSLIMQLNQILKKEDV